MHIVVYTWMEGVAACSRFSVNYADLDRSGKLETMTLCSFCCEHSLSFLHNEYNDEINSALCFAT